MIICSKSSRLALQVLALAVVISSALPWEEAHADSEQQIPGKIVGVTDGDTVTLLDSANVQYKIRLAGIDSPEKDQPFGMACKGRLSELVFNKIVLVVASKQDRYGRLVGKIIVNGVDANLEQIKSGCGWHYKQYQNEQYSEDRINYGDAEIEARVNKVGLWADSNPVPPWEWRGNRKRSPAR